MNSCEKVVGTVQPTLKIIGSVESPIGGGGGKDGVSPIVEITPISGGNRITITDVNGPKSTDIMDGSDGRDGTDGKTPVKGTDYFTSADKTELINAIKGSLTLGIASDGLIYLFVDGAPVGTGIPQGQSGDVFGYVDENNTVVLNGNLADGTYTLKYEMDNGKVVNIGDMVLDSTVYYSVTSNLTYCSISNSTKTVAEGSSYSATITANSGYELKSVTATMGGSAVTVTNGVINIASVTGNIVITAVAEEATVEINNLAQPDATATGEAAWNSGGWCNNSYMAGSSYAYRGATDGRLTTNTIAVEYGDKIYVKGIDYASATYPQVAVLDASGAKLSHGYAQNIYNNGYINELSASTGSDYWSFTLTSASGDRGVRFVRFAGYPSGDISDIIITRNQPIE
jgi:hypothetical protein